MIQVDKILHFFVGFVITIFFGTMFDIQVGLSLCLFAAVGKEIYDHYFGGDPDWKDILATMLGGLISALIII